MRLGASALTALALLVSCSGEPTVEASAGASPSTTEGSSPSDTPSTAPPVSSSPSPTAGAGPTIEPVLQLPVDAPRTFEGTVSTDGPFEPLVPPSAEVIDAWFQQPSGANPAFAWVVWGRGEDPFARELGVVLWERSPDDDAWRAIHGFTDRPTKGVLGISLEAADLTGDGFEDGLTFEQTGGTGACGRWRVVAPFRGGAMVALDRQTCDAELSIVGDHLELREAVYGPDDAHCCPSAFRTTTLEWDGRAFVETAVLEEPAT